MEKEIGCVEGLTVDTVQKLRRILAAHKVPSTLEGLQKIGIKGLFNFNIVPFGATIGERSLNQILTALRKIDVKMQITTDQFECIKFESVFGNYDGYLYRESVKAALNEHNALKQGNTKTNTKTKLKEKTVNK